VWRLVDVRPFTRADVPFAAALLAARPNAHPLAAPFDAVAEIEALLDDGATGYVAGGGYLIGTVDADGAWSQYAGHAARDVATYRHLYRALADDWVAAGQRRHCIVMPDGDPVAGPAFADLAFGREHVFALAALADQPSGAPSPDVAIRVGTLDDYDALAPMFPNLRRHLAGAPCFSPSTAAYYERLPEDFREDLADPNVTYHVARVEGRDVGFATWEPLPPRIRVPENAFALGHMSVVPEARGRGVGHALTLAGLALARDRGHTVTWTDWRLTNMSAEPHWRRYGWTPYKVRMTRRVEPLEP
jgi:GNAT superfamily N-acetyltransferase